MDTEAGFGAAEDGLMVHRLDSAVRIEFCFQTGETNDVGFTGREGRGANWLRTA
jgi:hypothetical protein